MDDDIQKQVWKTVQDMNRTWTVEKKADELANYFHENMVAITATDQKRLEGREACVASWKAFSDNASVHFWKELEPEVQVYGAGAFAVVTYYFDMSFDLGGQTIAMRGRDMVSLVHENGKWLIVADQFSQFPHP